MSVALVWDRDSVPLLHGEQDGLIEWMTEAERRDVRDILTIVARKLAKRPITAADARRKIEAIIAHLIAALDALDGDCDLEPHYAGMIRPGEDECEPDEHTDGFEPNLATTADEDATGYYAGRHLGMWAASQVDETEDACEDEGAQCDDEGCPDDNGLGDTGGKNEQGFA